MPARPTSEDLAIIRKMARSSRTLREIGLELGVSRQTVLNWCRNHGIETSSRSEAATRVAIKTQLRPPSTRKYSAALCEKIVALQGGDKSSAEIAAQFGLASPRVVTGIWGRARLRSKPQD